MKRTNQITHCSLAALSLTLLSACAGSSSSGTTTPTTATNLTYTDPTIGDYRLVRDATNSTGTHLILNLVGPTNTGLSGTGFFLTTDIAKVKWSMLDGGERISSNFFMNPRIIESKVTGGEFQAGVYQKGAVIEGVTGADTVLATIAMDLQLGQPTGPVTFSAPAGKAVLLNTPGSTGPTTPIVITVGTLTAN